MRSAWKWSVPFACLTLLACATAPTGAGPRGFDDPKNTMFTVDDPIRVGSTDLPPGTYVIRVLGHGTDLNTLQVTSSDLRYILATFQTRQAFHPAWETSSEGVLTFVEAPGMPHLLTFWDVPGHAYGYDIATVPSKPLVVATRLVRGSPVRVATR